MQSDIPEDVMKSANAVVVEMMKKEPMLAMAPFIARAIMAERTRCEAALSAADPISSIVPDHCSGTALIFEGGCLHVRKDGSGHIVVDEYDFKLEDDRCEGEHGPEGSVHWIARFPAGEMTVLRDFLNGQDFPAPPATSSAPPQCCMCGKKGLSTAEGDGGTEYELSDGRWVCSAECWDRAVEPAPSVAGKALRTAIHNGLIDGARLESDLQSEFDRTVDSILASVSAALSAQVQDVAGLESNPVTLRWWCQQLLDIIENYDISHGSCDEEIALINDIRSSVDPAAPAKQEERILHKHTNIRSGD